MLAIIGLIALLWLASPIILIIMYCVERKKRKQCENELAALKKLLPPKAPPPAPATQTVQTPPIKKTVPTVQPPQAPRPAYDMPFKQTYGQPDYVNNQPKPDAAPPQRQPHKKVSTINILFILGALFIILAGIIFATTTWNLLANGVRAIIIFSFSAVFFAASSLAERKFKLEKTGMLFYTLASVFLPITLIAAGYFYVFGPWFSLDGSGKFLLLALTAASLCAACFKGSVDYREKGGGKIFAMTALISLTATICMLILHFTKLPAVFALSASVYSLAAIIICERLSKRTSEKFSALLSQLRPFAIVNTIILSGAGLVACGFAPTVYLHDKLLATIASVIFALSFLQTLFTGKNAYCGTIPFMIFVICALFSIISPTGIDSLTFLAVAAAAVPAALTFMNIIPQGVKNAFRILSLISAVLALIFCFISSFATVPSLLSLVAYAVIAADMLVLGLKHRSETDGKLMIGFFPAACTILNILSSRFICGSANDSSLFLLFIGINLLLQVLFIFLPRIKIRTVASDVIFAASAISAEIAFLTSDYSNPVCIAAIAMSAAAIFLPILFRSEHNAYSIFAAVGVIMTSLVVIPIQSIFQDYIDYEYAVLIGTLVPFAVLTAATVLLVLAAKKKGGFTSAADKAVFVGYLCTSVLYFFSIAVDGKYSFIIVLIVTAVMLTRGYVRSYTPQTIAGLILLMLSAFVASVDFFMDISAFGAFAAAAVAATAIYFVNELAHGEKYTPINITARISLAALTAAMLFCFTAAFEAGEWIYSAVLPFFLLCVIQSYTAKKTLTLVPLCILLYPVLSTLCERAELGNGVFCALVWIVTALTVAASYLLHREKLFNKLYFDVWAFMRFLGIVFMAVNFGYGYDDEKLRWTAILLAGVCIAALIRTSHSPAAKKWLVTISAFTLVLAWQNQPFFTPPSVITLELWLLPALIYFTALQFLWKDHPKLISTVAFIAYAGSFVTLFAAALMDGEITDGLIIVISALALLIFSFAVKKKKWFILSVAVLLTSALFMSRMFRRSVAWWVYLLAAGLLLIAIGAVNELKKQSAESGKSGFAQKLSRFMSEWTW